MNRILIVCQHFWPENFRINDIADYIIERGDKVNVLCGIPNYPKGKFYDGYSVLKNRTQTHKNIVIRRALELPRGNNTNLGIFINYLSFPLFSLFHVPRLALKKHDKIFLYQLSPVMMSLAGIIIGKIRNTETTLYILDLWPENLFSVLPIRSELLRKIATKISHWHYRHVDKLIVLSERTKTHLINQVGIAAERIVVIPQSSEKIYEQRPKKLVPPGQPLGHGFNIVFTGSITPAQSFHTMIEAAQIIKATGVNARWTIVGDGMSKKDTEKLVADANLSDVFSFEGQHPIEDMPKYIAGADVLVGCLVKSELLEATIPAKVMSYIASGKPMVLAMDGEVQTLINKTIGCGFAGPTEDAKSLANNILKIYRMSAKDRDTLGKKARDYHFKHFERNIVLGKLYDFIFNPSPVK